MEDIIFKQDPELSGETYILKQERLIIVEKSLGLSKDRVIRLRDISLDSELTERRFSRFYLLPLLFSVIAAIALWHILKSDTISHFIAIFPSILIPALLWHMNKGFEPIEACRFKDNKGEIIFELYRPRKSKLNYDAFVSALRNRIERSRST